MHVSGFHKNVVSRPWLAELSYADGTCVSVEVYAESEANAYLQAEAIAENHEKEYDGLPIDIRIFSR